jgi:hypothetical protein
MRHLIPLYFFLLAGISACSQHVPVIQKLDSLPDRETCKIAVLPFLNESSFAQGGAILNTIFLSELVDTGKFQVIQEGDILEVYRQLLIYPNELPNREQLEMMGGRLNADLYIGGIVQKMSTQSSGAFSDPEITLVLLIYDGKSGKLLWTTYHRRRGNDYQKIMHLGRITTIAGLAHRMSQETITDWFAKGLTSCIK